MDGKEAVLMAREHLKDVVSGVLPDVGFATGDISRFDFKEWEVKCWVFSTISQKMVEYKVVIVDDKVESAIQIDDKTDTTESEDPREQYIEEHLKVVRDRQAAELAKSRQYFGDEWDEEHGDKNA